jgi:hypothetical protein
MTRVENWLFDVAPDEVIKLRCQIGLISGASASASSWSISYTGTGLGDSKKGKVLASPKVILPRSFHVMIIEMSFGARSARSQGRTAPGH